jgi:hypothetical protein
MKGNVVTVIFTCSLRDVREMNAYRTDSVRLSICFNSRATGRILIKIDMNVMPLKPTPDSYFLVSYN